MPTIPTLTGLLATIEAIPETPENYRALREARDAAKKLTTRTLGYIVVDRGGTMVGNQHKHSESAQALADEWTADCKAAGVDWDYRVVEITERAA